MTSKPGSVIVWSRCRPALWKIDIPADSKLLIFDHDTLGYKKAYKWITSAPEAKTCTKLYRMIIHCTQDKAAKDLDDYERLRRASPSTMPPAFTGHVECWPDGTKFDIEPIIMDKIPSGHPDSLDWPPPERKGGGEEEEEGCRLSTIYACAFCSDRPLRYPDIFTGLTQIQQYILDKVRADTLTMHEVVQLAAAKFRVEVEMVVEQYELMTMGNDPWIASPPGRAIHARPGTFSDLLPGWLVNGPFPIHPRVLRDKYITMIKNGESTATWNGLEPFCPPYSFVCDGGEWYGNTPQGLGAGERVVKPPYRWSMARFRASMPDDFEDYTWGLVRLPSKLLTFKVEPKLTFYCQVEGRLVSFGTVDQYAKRWYKLKLDKMIRKSHARSFYEKRIEQEYEYLRTIFTGAREDVKGEDGITTSRRMYIDEDRPAKLRRLMDNYGPDHFEHLRDLPIIKLGPRNYFDEDEIPQSRAFARGRWLEELTNLNV